MSDLEIESLRIDLGDAAGQEYRLRPLVERALTLLSERLGEWGPGADTRDLGDVRVPDLRLDLARTGDEAAASALADALRDAIALKLSC